MVTQASLSCRRLSMRLPLEPWIYRYSPSRQQAVGYAVRAQAVGKGDVAQVGGVDDRVQGGGVVVRVGGDAAYAGARAGGVGVVVHVLHLRKVRHQYNAMLALK